MTSHKRHFEDAVTVITCIALTFALVLIMGIRSCAHAEDISVKAIAIMESSGNPFARNGNHYGLCQISSEVLYDYNKDNGTIWNTIDLYNGVINLRVANWYLNREIPRMLKHFKKPDTVENRLTAWRRGIRWVLNGKKATKYIQKYLTLAH